MTSVLIVDDEEDLLIVLSGLLKKRGFDVDTIADATGILEKVDKLQPDIILLDINLGNNNDGRIICKAIKEQPSTQNVSVILSSAHHDLQAEYKKYDADAFLAKPIILTTLVDKMNDVLTRNKKV